MSEPKKLVVIGAGMASGRVLEEVFERAPGQFDVTLINAEPRGNYNRIMLSPVLSGEKTFEEIVTHDAEWYEANGVTCRFGERVGAIDREEKTVTTDAGTTIPYDTLVMGMGSEPFVIPVPGHDLPGVCTYRDLNDVEVMLESSKRGGHAVIIGGGLLGLEAAAGLKAQGKEVTVLHLMPTLMERQLDQAAGHLLQRAIEEKGIAVHTRANTHSIRGKGHVEAVLLDDGTEIPCDLVVMAVGIRPAAALGKVAGLEVGRGIVVGDDMLTSDPAIFAVGECVEHRGQCYGLVAPLYEMAKVAASTIIGESAGYEGSVTSTKLKVTGVDLFSAGDFAEGDDREEIVFRDATAGVYKRLILRDDRIIGAVMYGDTKDGAYFFDLLKRGADISADRDTLIFGQSFAGSTPLDPMAAVAALPDEAEICGCNGICKSKIVTAIEGGATTLDAVRSTTKASSSCGTCTGLVEQLMAIALGDEFEAHAVKPMCKCTDLDHMDVRHLILAKEIKTIPGLMQALEWKTSCGCHVCRPALNYYLLCAWPGDYMDDGQSRFINERFHANIQKDGTYSVVPRMWGGITTPNELRAIADVADKFAIPTVKVTGGQRIDLLGVRGEDLPHVWADLNAAGMVSGHAYAKGLRTVKTCVGTDHCRFGTQDSTGLGIKLERAMWGAWSPHKFKLAVSGCPRNCAEATCKDFGVVCVDSGYELLVGGAAGMDVRETDFLAKVATEDEALEYCQAFFQLYREGAQYLDRPYKWIAKVGLDWVREQIADLETRAALYDRFRHAQQFMQIDPWAERAMDVVKARKFAPLADLTLEAAE